MCELCSGLLSGYLCIGLMFGFGCKVVVLLLCDFYVCYLDIMFDLLLNDWLVDFFVDCIDVVFCDGCMEDSVIVVCWLILM